MTVIFMDFTDQMPEKSDPIANSGKQNVLVYRTLQNLLKFLQGDVVMQNLRWLLLCLHDIGIYGMFWNITETIQMVVNF